MCYTIKIDLTREELERRFGAKFTDPDSYQAGVKINAFSLPKLPVICCDNPSEIRIYQWGLIPFWIANQEKAKEIRTKTFNARSESLAEKPSFNKSLIYRRCIVLVNGFYEWQTDGKRKIPYFIGVSDTNGFALAGLYDHWTDPITGEKMDTFTVITTRANPMLEVIHNSKKRMPVILSGADEKKWLDIKENPAFFFDPFPEQSMFATQL